MLGMVSALTLSARLSAAEPPPLRFVRTPEGGWETTVTLPASEPVVRTVLLDPIAAANLAPDIRAIAYVEDGECDTLSVETAGFASVTYVYRRCPTTDGWHEWLLSSSSLDVYEVRWRLLAQGPVTHVTYMVRIDPRLPAPDFVLARQVRGTMTSVLNGLFRTVAPAPGTPQAE